MSRRRAYTEAGCRELSGLGLTPRSVSQDEAKVRAHCGTELWAQVSA